MLTTSLQKSFLVIDIDLTGVNLKRDFKYDLHTIDESYQCLRVTGTAKHSAEPFEVTETLQSNALRQGMFVEDIALPLYVKTKTLKFFRHSERYVRFLFDLKTDEERKLQQNLASGELSVFK